MQLGQGGERGECLAAEAKRLEGGEVVVGGELGRMVLEGYRLEVLRRDTRAIILNLDGA